ncbi:MAG TPA: preprotein translocase subunit SecA [Solirubrobacterales bacterium]|nr:preprotein translocase subunit SecA [Solirubrobacterales bacterium]
MPPIIDSVLRAGEGRLLRKLKRISEQINSIEDDFVAMSDAELRAMTDEFRQRHSDGETLDDLMPEAFAAVREAAKRTLGQRAFDVQLMGAAALHLGNIAEMRTGEGKTLTGVFPAYLNALAGQGVHVVTVNDYLAKRDAEWMMPIYEACGVTVGILQNNMDPDDKIEAYACDVTYGTNSEFGFDYLRDNMAQSMEDKVQHGGRLGEDGKPLAMHYYAIVDEVDNILIDEARTPLIISGAPEAAADHYVKFAKLAKVMTAGKTPEGMDPRARKDFVADFDFEYDEKHKTVAVTEQGVQKAEKFLGISHLYRAENGPLVNHLLQSLKAESLYKRDVDYAVVDDEVKIIDEFTGRILDGRRWSEGLHQAVEAKEGVAVQEENQTLATITYQNFFRMYSKLAGMTGTALTEATEFMKIYKLPVVQIPTNQPMVRKDRNDQVYKTREGKWTALLNAITERHALGQPILVGTISVEVSEMLSRRLDKLGIPHSVLNAKPEHAAREGEVVAEAGRPGAVTIATNMAGRGVDIKLGGNPEHQTQGELRNLGLTSGDPDYDERYAEIFPKIEEKIAVDHDKVLEAGGLFICGTERHESRRIDNQLRGRAGRQGDPGESRFFLSAEDDLVRLFAGDRIYKILDKLGTVDEDGNEEPIEAGMLSKQIEKAQKKVEEQNYLQRKRVLEYDDVMNEQRRIVYAYRDQVLEGNDMGQTAREEIDHVIARLVEDYTPGDYVEEWDLDGLFTAVQDVFPVMFGQDDIDWQSTDREGLIDELTTEARELYDKREAQLDELEEGMMRQLERVLLLQIIDQRWREHLYDMDYLREGIHLRGFAQIEPIVAYKNEAFELFTDLMNTIWSDFSRMVYNVQVEVEGDLPNSPQGESVSPRNVSYTGGVGTVQPSAIAQAASAEGNGVATEDSPMPSAFVEQRKLDDTEKLGRNDPCWCGSGKKYKNCHAA